MRGPKKRGIKNKGLKILKNSGILDAYENLLESLCKYGLPTGDLYEFSALTVLKYEKKFKALKKKELQDRLKRREEERKNKLAILEGEPEMKAIKASKRDKSKRRDEDSESDEEPKRGKKGKKSKKKHDSDDDREADDKKSTKSKRKKK